MNMSPLDDVVMNHRRFARYRVVFFSLFLYCFSRMVLDFNDFSTFFFLSLAPNHIECVGFYFFVLGGIFKLKDECFTLFAAHIHHFCFYMTFEPNNSTIFTSFTLYGCQTETFKSRAWQKKWMKKNMKRSNSVKANRWCVYAHVLGLQKAVNDNNFFCS